MGESSKNLPPAIAQLGILFIFATKFKTSKFDTTKFNTSNMTSNTYTRKYKFFINLILIAGVSFTSCINNIPHEDEMPQAGDTPILLNVSQNQTNALALDNSFKSGDQIGLYVTIQPSTLQNTRYVDNSSYTYSTGAGFSSDESIFFPEGNNSCNFMVYYPHQKKGITGGSSELEVQVPADQSSLTRLSDYDFMVGTATGIKASTTSVKLDMEHKLFYYDIRLKVESGYTLESLLDAAPEVRIKDVYTKATYDFSTGQFTNLSEKKDVIPHGEWVIKDNMLCGKSALVIPQTIPDPQNIIELYVDNHIYECSYEQEYTLESGMIEENQITLQSSEDAAKISLDINVKEWNQKQSEMDATLRVSSIQTEDLDFTASNVIKVMGKDEQVAEICKEYLLADGVDSQATVIYPVENGKADLTKGLVIELIGDAGTTHGGSVNWNTSTNLLTYTAGSSPVLSHIYIAPDGSITTTRPANALQVELVSDRLIDSRGDEVIEYPLAKIATQYWLRNNYRPTRYNDGTKIELGGTTAINTTAQHYVRSEVYYFYNSKAIATSKLTAQGWKVASESDYTRLTTYVKNNAAVLKNGITWQNSEYGYTNLTGLNVAATGYFDPAFKNNAISAAYWSTQDNDPTITGKMVTLQISDNSIKTAAVSGNKALAIRCIRE